MRLIYISATFPPNSVSVSSDSTIFLNHRNLYLEMAYEVDTKGEIGKPITGTAGVVIDCTDAVVVELLAVDR